MAEKTNSPKQTQKRRMKILLAYDGSPHAQAAVALVRSLPLDVESPINVIAVLPSQWITGHEELQADLARVQVSLHRKFKHVKADLLAGNPAATINKQADELGVDLVVMGAKGLRATLGILLGGVAQQVVEYSNSPVLVVRSHGEDLRQATRLRDVLLVIDGSEQGWKAVDYLAGKGCGKNMSLCGMPIPKEAQMTVMHVLPPVVSPEMAMRAWMIGPEALYPAPIEPVDWDTLQVKEEQLGNKLIEESATALKAAGVKVSNVLRRGDAATEILEYVKAHPQDLIVCGSRGLSEVTGWLLGSVSRKLVHYASCSVLIVK